MRFFVGYLVLAALTMAHAASPESTPSMSEPIPSPSLIIIGASYAADWGQPALPGYASIVNKGVGGQTSNDVRERFQQDVLAAAPTATLIWGHYNDVVRAPPEQVEQAKAKARENYQWMVQQARQAGVEPILATEITMPTGTGWIDQLIALAGRVMGKQDYRDRVNGHVQDVNAWLRDYARQNRIDLWDLEQALDSGSGSRKVEYALEDGSHVSQAGYAAMTDYVVNHLRRNAR